MRRIAVDQSRRNAARRARKVRARHRLAGHLGVRLEPMLTTGKINYEVGDRVEATPYGGIAAIHQMAVALGLPEAVNDALSLLKVHMPYHESDHVLNMAYNVHAPRGASSYPQRSWEELEGRFLGLMAYLDAKAARGQ